ncbi:dicarboxylate/amino acid:cation symporter [Candidatus Nitronereus thalassa]|uniref:Dicarboxylate/amino acid:cation symporter n=1 Tax=Candidatus Nitronereus thalassa TaxID=3020898 RepID=A0ABU3KC46_9BACT|nr:dicarboxylate/amino acid:cation symporter [Candidatus Nitronereus thalassa]MDT7043883.1 dicarboxylate/amino acid:cation symporter [Candidatus Nitronereus thalassa]
MVIGALAGGVLGAMAPEAAQHVVVLGDLWIRMLQMLVVPLIISSIIQGVGSLGDIRHLGRLGGVTVAYYLITSGLAIILGMILVKLIQPGVGADITAAVAPLGTEAAVKHGWIDLLRGFISPNIFASATQGDLLPLVIFSLAFGAVLTTVGEKGQLVINIFEGIFAAIMKLVHLVMWIGPIGVFGLVAGRLAIAGGSEGIVALLVGLGLFTITVIVGLVIHAGISLGLILHLAGQRHPFTYMGFLGAALTSAFATASSSATLPLTMEGVERAGIRTRSSRFVLPIGATVNMDGSALYEAVAAVFIAQAWGIDLPVTALMALFIVATVSTIGAAGIPEAGLVTMVVVLQAVGLPLEGLGLLLAIDWLIDRFRTAVNVWGDAVGAAVVDRYVPG